MKLLFLSFIPPLHNAKFVFGVWMGAISHCTWANWDLHAALLSHAKLSSIHDRCHLCSYFFRVCLSG